MIGFDYDKAEIEYEAGPLRHRDPDSLSGVAIQEFEEFV